MVAVLPGAAEPELQLGSFGTVEMPAEGPEGRMSEPCQQLYQNAVRQLSESAVAIRYASRAK